MSDNVHKVPKGPERILCDMCPEEDRKPARKTCLKCEISMCVQHLQAHLTKPLLMQTHSLTEPMTLDGNIKCPHHGKLLEYYCLDDMTCVCVSCAIEDQHRLHNMKTFPTAHKDLMVKLQAEQQVLKEKKDEDNLSLEKWEKSEREKLGRCSVRLIEAVTNLRDISLTSVQSSVSARVVSIRTSKSSMQAAQNEKDTFRFLQMYSQVHQDVEKAKAVDLRKGLEPGKDRDKLVQEIRQNGEKMLEQASQFLGSMLALVDPENHQELLATRSHLIFEPQMLESSMFLSKDNRKVFYKRSLGPCSGTLLIQSKQTASNFQSWMVSLPKDSDWMVGVSDNCYMRNLSNNCTYGLLCKDNSLCYLSTTEYDNPNSICSDSRNYRVSSSSIRHHTRDLDEPVPRLEKVEVFWNWNSSTLSFFNRIGQYQREKIITLQMSLSHVRLLPFVQLGKENSPKCPQKEWQCSCGLVYNKTVNGYSRGRNQFYFLANCRCGKVLGGITEVVCELC